MTLQAQSWPLTGGLDLVTSPILRSRIPGTLVECVNYEAREDGYRRIDGYERFDGRPAPSEFVEFDVPETATDTPAIRRANIQPVPGSGPFAGIAYFASDVWAWRWDRTAEEAAVDRIPSNLHLWRSSPAGWREVASPRLVWFEEGEFQTDPSEAGGTFVPSEEAVWERNANVRFRVDRVILVSGAWDSGDAAGYVVSTGSSARVMVTGGIPERVNPKGARFTFVLNIGRVRVRLAVTPGAGAAGPDEEARTARIRRFAPQVLFGSSYYPDGRVRYEIRNFFAGAGTRRLYMASGVGPAFELSADGVAVPVYTRPDDPDSDRPEFVGFQGSHLALGYSTGQVAISSLGEPHRFDGTAGAAEIGTGGEITGMLSGFRNVLFVFGPNRTSVLTGETSEQFALRVLSREAGAAADMFQELTVPYIWDERGLRSITTVDAIGDFSINEITGTIRPWVEEHRRNRIMPTASVRVRAKAQMRVWFEDGDCLVLGLIGQEPEVSQVFSVLSYDFPREASGSPAIVRHTTSEEDANGQERVFATFDGAGYVYELDRGVSFDGFPIRSYLRMGHNDLRSPLQQKRFLKVAIEGVSSGLGRSQFRTFATFDDDLRDSEGPEVSVGARATRWDEARWNTFNWDEVVARLGETRVAGYGRNISVQVLAESADAPPHVLTGCTVLYEPRRTRR